MYNADTERIRIVMYADPNHCWQIVIVLLLFKNICIEASPW